MANNISDISARAMLDIRPFSRGLSNMDSQARDGVTRLTERFSEMHKNVSGFMQGLAASFAFRGIRAGVHAIRDAIRELEADVAAGRASERAQSIVAELQAMRPELAAIKDEWNTLLGDIAVGFGRIATAHTNLAHMLANEQITPAQHSLLWWLTTIVPLAGAGIPAPQGQTGPLTPSAKTASNLFPMLFNAIDKLHDTLVQGAQALGLELEKTEQLRKQARRPTEAAGESIREIMARPFLNQLDQARLVQRQIESLTAGMRDTPELGSLEQGSREAAAIIAQANRPQIDHLAAIRAMLEGEREADVEALALWREMRDALVGKNIWAQPP